MEFVVLLYSDIFIFDPYRENEFIRLTDKRLRESLSVRLKFLKFFFLCCSDFLSSRFRFSRWKSCTERGGWCAGGVGSPGDAWIRFLGARDSARLAPCHSQQTPLPSAPPIPIPLTPDSSFQFQLQLQLFCVVESTRHIRGSVILCTYRYYTLYRTVVVLVVIGVSTPEGTAIGRTRSNPTPAY